MHRGAVQPREYGRHAIGNSVWINTRHDRLLLKHGSPLVIRQKAQGCSPLNHHHPQHISQSNSAKRELGRLLEKENTLYTNMFHSNKLGYPYKHFKVRIG